MASARYLEIKYNVSIELGDHMKGQLDLIKLLSFAMPDTSDHSSSTTLPRIQIFELQASISLFSRLPEWIRKLRKLCVLEIVVRELDMDDIVVLGGFPALRVLFMYVRKPLEGHIVFSIGSFPALEYLKVMSGKLWLDFQKEAMPNLRTLDIGFTAHQGKNNVMVAGIQHLLNFQHIKASIGTTSQEEYKRAMSVLMESIKLRTNRTGSSFKMSPPIEQERQGSLNDLYQLTNQGWPIDKHIIQKQAPTKDTKKHDDTGSSLFSALPEPSESSGNR